MLFYWRTIVLTKSEVDRTLPLTHLTHLYLIRSICWHFLFAYWIVYYTFNKIVWKFWVIFFLFFLSCLVEYFSSLGSWIIERRLFFIFYFWFGTKHSWSWFVCSWKWWLFITLFVLKSIHFLINFISLCTYWWRVEDWSFVLIIFVL